MTYKQLAVELKLSESAVKQMFASDNFSVKRLDQICEILDTDIAGLVEISQQNENKIEQITLEQEKILTRDPKLLVTAYCLVNYWTVDEIVQEYDISDTQMIQLLVKLDKMGLIELLPGNRVRPRIAMSFNWQSNGPIEHYFKQQVQREFFNSNFNNRGELQIIKNGDISTTAQITLHNRLKLIDQLFDDIASQEKKLPAEQRQGVSMILAIRSWQYTAFEKLKRPEKLLN